MRSASTSAWTKWRRTGAWRGRPIASARRSARVAAGIASVLLMAIRQLGPLLLGVILLAIVLLARPGRVRELARRRDVRWAAGIVVASGLVMLVWLLTSGVTDFAAAPQRSLSYGPFSTLRQIVAVRVPFYLQQLVGQFSYGETTLPIWAIIAWYVVVGALAVPAALVAGRRYRVAIVGLVAVCVAILVALEFAFIHSAGWFAHSRYVLPSGVGAVLAACFVRRWQAALGAAATARLVRLAVVVAVPVHLYALATVMTRFQIGPTSMMQPFHGSWLPKGGPLPALAVEIVGLAVLAVLVWRGTRNSSAESADDHMADVPATAELA